MEKEKIIEAIKNGDFFWMLRRKLHYTYLVKRKFFIAHNMNTKQLLLQDCAYRKINRKYKRYIANYSPKFVEHEFEKKIWICWLQGYDNAPSFIKACINSVKENAKGFEVVILTDDNIHDFVSIPDYILEKYKQGKISPTHFSDVLRVTLLCERGGIWVDSTVLCTNGAFFDMLLKYPLFVFKSLDLTRIDTDSIVASNWFISSFENSAILYLTKDLLYKYWEDADYIVDYFLFHIIFTLATQKYIDEWEKIPMFENRAPHVLMFELEKDYSEERWKQIIRMSDIHKLTRHVCFEDNTKSNYNYILKKYGINDCKTDKYND